MPEDEGDKADGEVGEQAGEADDDPAKARGAKLRLRAVDEGQGKEGDQHDPGVSHRDAKAGGGEEMPGFVRQFQEGCDQREGGERAEREDVADMIDKDEPGGCAEPYGEERKQDEERKAAPGKQRPRQPGDGRLQRACVK